MRSRSSLNKAAKVLLIFVAGFLTGQIVPVVWKLALTELMQATYAEATYRCDRAMREQLFEKQSVDLEPTEESVVALKSSEIALLDCQDYDIMRKRLLMFGLDENSLSYMALQAIESKMRDLQEVIDIHEIRY